MIIQVSPDKDSSGDICFSCSFSSTSKLLCAVNNLIVVSFCVKFIFLTACMRYLTAIYLKCCELISFIGYFLFS